MRKFLFCLCLTFAVSAFGADVKIDFGDFTTGQTPTGFHPALAGPGQPGDWKIIKAEVPSAFASLTPGAVAFTRESVLAQMSQDPTDNRFPMLIYDGGTFKDFTLTTRFKIISGVAEQMAGVVFHYQNESNFYVFRASALGHNVRFYKVVNGQFADPSAPLEMNITTNAWHTLTVQCEGDQINCALDNTALPAIETPDTFPEGKIGFWTMSDSVTCYGNTAITYKPLVPAAQVLVENIMTQEPRILGLRICALDGDGQPRIIASKDEAEIGRLGTGLDAAAITNGTVSFGRGPGTVAVILPFRDRNGDPMAAVWVRLQSFFGETQDTALTRARAILQKMEVQINSRHDLMQ